MKICNVQECLSLSPAHVGDVDVKEKKFPYKKVKVEDTVIYIGYTSLIYTRRGRVHLNQMIT